MRKLLFSALLALECCSLSAQDCCSDEWLNDFYVEGSYLYWQVYGDNFEFYDLGKLDQTNVNDTHGVENLITQKMHYEPGFKLGFGFNLPTNGFDVKAIWTDFHNKGTKRAKVAGTDPSTIWTSIAWPYTYDAWNVEINGLASLRQKISFVYDTVNLEFGKWLQFECVNVAFRPHVGFQYLGYKDHRKLFQNLVVTDSPSDNDGDYTLSTKQKFQGYGIRGGFDLKLPLICAFSLVGNAAASLDWGKDKVVLSGSQDILTRADDAKISKHNRTTRTLIDLAIGLRWETLLCDCWGLSLEALWEQHEIVNGSRLFWASSNLFRQTQYYSAVDKTGDLSLRGLTIKADLSF